MHSYCLFLSLVSALAKKKRPSLCTRLCFTPVFFVCLPVIFHNIPRTHTLFLSLSVFTVSHLLIFHTIPRTHALFLSLSVFTVSPLTIFHTIPRARSLSRCLYFCLSLSVYLSVCLLTFFVSIFDCPFVSICL